MIEYGVEQRVLTFALLLPNAGLFFVVRVGGVRPGEKQQKHNNLASPLPYYIHITHVGIQSHGMCSTRRL